MRKFDVYEGPDGKNEAVKIGFSWPAFFFTWIWSFVALRKLYFGFALLFFEFIFWFAIAGILYFIMLQFDIPREWLERWERLIEVACYLPYRIVLGKFGNNLKRKDLESKGFRRLATNVEAREEEDAIIDVKPEVLEDKPLLKKANNLISEGNNIEAEMILKRIIIEHRKSKMADIARSKLSDLRSK